MKNINIAICDDEKEICFVLETMLRRLFAEMETIILIDTYINSEKLLEEMKRTEYDLLFLDIELPGMNGVMAGTYIREVLHNERIQIAYISGKEGYAMELFDTRPINFLVKPLCEDKVKKVVDKYMVLSKEGEQFFTYKKGREIQKVKLADIMYFSSDNRKVMIHMQDRREEIYGTLQEIYENLQAKHFLYIHKSFLVNYKYVQTIEYEQITMTDGSKIPISQSRRSTVRARCMEIMREEK